MALLEGLASSEPTPGELAVDDDAYPVFVGMGDQAVRPVTSTVSVLRQRVLRRFRRVERRLRRRVGPPIRGGSLSLLYHRAAPESVDPWRWPSIRPISPSTWRSWPAIPDRRQPPDCANA